MFPLRLLLLSRPLNIGPKKCVESVTGIWPTASSYWLALSFTNDVNMNTDDSLTSSGSDSSLAGQIEAVFEHLRVTQPSTSFIDTHRQGDNVYVCVCVSVRNTFPHRELRRIISDILEVSSVRLVEVVGDSGSDFTSEGCTRALTVLNKHVTPGTVLEYGLTSKGRDSAWAVGECLSSSIASSTHALGNVVNASLAALRAGWSASRLAKIFTVLYNADGMPTDFGDDTWLSDGLLDPSFKDELICLEGGVQSFHQAVNALINAVPVFACTGLREEVQRFSAAHLLLELKSIDMSDDKVLGSTLETYLCTLKAMSEVTRQKIKDDVLRLRSIASLQHLLQAA